MEAICKWLPAAVTVSRIYCTTSATLQKLPLFVFLSVVPVLWLLAWLTQTRVYVTARTNPGIVVSLLTKMKLWNFQGTGGKHRFVTEIKVLGTSEQGGFSWAVEVRTCCRRCGAQRQKPDVHLNSHTHSLGAFAALYRQEGCVALSFWDRSTQSASALQNDSLRWPCTCTREECRNSGHVGAARTRGLLSTCHSEPPAKCRRQNNHTSNGNWSINGHSFFDATIFLCHLSFHLSRISLAQTSVSLQKWEMHGVNFAIQTTFVQPACGWLTVAKITFSVCFFAQK